MTSKDKLKEEIGLNKLLMTISSAIAISLIGWLFKNFNEQYSLRFFIVFITLTIFLSLTRYYLKNINAKIKEL